jgi:hypothetical protein
VNQFIDEQVGPFGERRTPLWRVNFIIVSAEAILKLNRKDVNGNELPIQERADQILRAASGSRKIEPRWFQLAWLVKHWPAFAMFAMEVKEGQQLDET